MMEGATLAQADFLSLKYEWSQGVSCEADQGRLTLDLEFLLNRTKESWPST